MSKFKKIPYYHVIRVLTVDGAEINQKVDIELSRNYYLQLIRLFLDFQFTKNSIDKIQLCDNRLQPIVEFSWRKHT